MRNPSSSSAAGATTSSAAAAAAAGSNSNNNTSSSSRTPCCSKVGLKRGPWTPEEDELLSNYIRKEGEGRWRTLPKRAGLLRCGKSCRLRWMNYLRPSVKRGQIAPDEEDIILRLHRLLGNRWSLIAGRIPGRTDNEIKNYWNTHLSKKLISQGIDPRTHKPLNPNSSSENPPNAIPNHGSSSSSKPTTAPLPLPPPQPNPISTDDDQETPPAVNQENGYFTVDQYQAYENLPAAAVTDSDHGSAVGFRSNNTIIHNEDDHEDINYCSDDVFSSFLNSLINEEAFASQHQLQQYPTNNGIHAAESSEPLITNIHPSSFGFGTIGWESAIMASASAFAQNDPKRKEHVE
ncbi:hypothetical protein L6164_012440 [Bauhinia variegata]|uniref:Uncharacterized protein n=1 Tax=Bauhinia variegata TaxID=167791 RepID=A0ACB9PBK5_BAUVA|nr:hypothetical protein L6164_012440 [Bauhinia variegata]